MTDKALVHHLSAPRAKGRPRVSTVIVVTLGVAFAVVMLSPFLLVAMNSFKSNADYSANGPLALPKALDLSAFERFLTLIDFPTALWNSVLVSGLVTLGGLLISVLAAYAIGIGRIKARTWVVAVLLIATMVPQEALVYPLFYGAQATSTLNTVWSVIVIFIVIQGAYGTYLLAGVLGTFPKELIEAARVDGASAWRILWRVVVPVLRPTLSVLAVFFFIWTWNEFYLPVVLLGDSSSQTIPIALATIAQMLVMTINDLDLSMGTFVSFVACVTATFVQSDPLVGALILIGCIALYAALGVVMVMFTRWRRTKAATASPQGQLNSSSSTEIESQTGSGR